MLYENACMSDVLSVGAQRDCCVVLPTLEHATFWWPAIYQMHADRQNVMRTRTGCVLRDSHTAIRLWVPYSHDPTMPMDHEHEDVYHMDYLLLWGLSKREDVKWAR